MEKLEALRQAGRLALVDRPRLAGRMRSAQRRRHFQELADSWDLWYELYYANDPPGMSRAEYEAVTEKEAARLAAWLRPGARFLDLGCGDGRILERAAPLCREAHGADVSPKALALTRERCRGARNVRLRRVTGLDLPYDDKSLDLVYCHLMLSQLDAEPVVRLFQEAGRVLAPGGRFVFDVPNLLGAPNVDYLLSPGSTNWPGHDRPRFWTAESVKVFLPRCGFDVESLDAGRWLDVVAVKR